MDTIWSGTLVVPVEALLRVDEEMVVRVELVVVLGGGIPQVVQVVGCVVGGMVRVIVEVRQRYVGALVMVQRP